MLDQIQREIIFLGPPGSGKGTQANILSGYLHVPHISTGDLLRDHLKRLTPLGVTIKDYMDQGKLVPDALVCEVLEDRLSEIDCQNGYILDGFPRTVAQAELLSRRRTYRVNTLVLFLEVPDKVVVDRIAGRRICSQCQSVYHMKSSSLIEEGMCDKCGAPLYQRSDDRAEVVLQRLQAYHEQTVPVLNYYEGRGILKTCDGDRSSDVVTDELIKLINGI